MQPEHLSNSFPHVHSTTRWVLIIFLATLPLVLAPATVVRSASLTVNTTVDNTSPAPGITRISVASDGAQADKNSGGEDISQDGRYVTFHSNGTNLAQNDTNGMWDVFVHDRLTGATTLVSQSSLGEQGNGMSHGGSMTADGRYIAYQSGADNLVNGDNNDAVDIFLFDRQTGLTTLISLSSQGDQATMLSVGPQINADGGYVVFYSEADNLVDNDTNTVEDIFLRNLLTNQTSRVSVSSAGVQANGPSTSPSISADGRYIAFTSAADNLVAGDANGARDVFVHDCITGSTIRVSVASDGSQGDQESAFSRISADGRYVVFLSEASNLVAGDANNLRDVFVHDLQTGATLLASVASNGEQANQIAKLPSISADGRYVVFYSEADNLTEGDTNQKSDVFLHDCRNGSTIRLSMAPGGQEADNSSTNPRISGDGRFVAFDSFAANLVAGDTNDTVDVFLYDSLGGMDQAVWIPFVER